MRRMTNRSRRRRGDDGATLVLIAISMVILFGMAALVIDVGALVEERRTLQNGADAAALAVALDCAKGDCGDATATAASYANLNADDDLANIDTVCGTGPGLSPCASPPAGVTGNYVMVTTSTLSAGGSPLVPFRFGQAIGAGSGRTVRRTAVAAWDNIGSATTIPMTISMCEFNALVGSPENLPSATVYIYFHGTGDVGQPECPTTVPNSDTPISGGFGYLGDSTGCYVTIGSGNWVSAQPGNALPSGCDPVSLQNLDIVMPIYDGTNELAGSNGEYHIGGFALFQITGYKFNGSGSSNAWNMTGNKCPLGNGADAVCLEGIFKRYATNIGDLLATATNYGTTVVVLVA